MKVVYEVNLSPKSEVWEKAVDWELPFLPALYNQVDIGVGETFRLAGLTFSFNTIRFHLQDFSNNRCEQKLAAVGFQRIPK